jgi:hypothetical protein
MASRDDLDPKSLSEKTVYVADFAKVVPKFKTFHWAALGTRAESSLLTRLN